MLYLSIIMLSKVAEAEGDLMLVLGRVHNFIFLEF